MKWIKGRRPSPAMVISLLALFVALGGTGYAAIVLPANSVGSKQLKKSAVSNKKIAKNAVTTSKVKDGSLLKGDFAAGQLPAGAAGPAGSAGPAGPTGPTGPAGTNGTNGTNGTDGLITSATVQRTTGAAVADGAEQTITVSCPAGQKAIAGGVRADASGVGYVESTRPVVGTSGTPNDGETFDGWRATVENPTGGAASITPDYWVVCAS